MLKTFSLLLTDAVGKSVPADTVPSQESILLDAEKGILVISQWSGLGMSINHRYEFKDELRNIIPELLDLCRCCIEGGNWNCSQEGKLPWFRMRAEYYSGQTASREGCYNRGDIPGETWLPFIDALRKLIGAFSYSDLLSVSAFMSAGRPGDIRLCSVVFDCGGQAYSYRSEDESIEAGDLVLVPVGWENTPKTACVDRIEFYPPGNTPYPLEKLKWVIGPAPPPPDE